MKNRQAAITFVLVTVMLDVLAIGIIAPVLPKLILDFLGGNMKNAADWNGGFGTVFAIMQFVCSPLLGVLSDRRGRRPIILLSNLGLGLDYIVMAISPSIYWLLVGRIISGITSASIPTAMAYIADVTPKEKRAGAFGLIGMAFGLGFVIGPAVGGVLGNMNPRMPFWVAAGFSLLNFCWGFFVLPESLPADHRKEFTWRRANPFGSLKLLRSHHELWRLATIQFLAYTAHNVFSIWALYAIFRYAWTQGAIGFSLAVVGACSIVTSGFLAGFLAKKIGERRTLYTGQFFGACGMICAGVARAGSYFLSSIPVICLWNIAMPSAQSMMTRRVSEREQGELQGAIGSVRSLAFVIGPGLFSWTFAWCINGGRHFPGGPFFLAAALLGVACFLSTRIPKIVPAISDPSPDLEERAKAEEIISGSATPIAGEFISEED